ncbi:hypothetical protein NMY22_g1028 [Coprinellus aureogranulatus]|nr:hypothetical protein NMY22_g1028 [Coprinellus aureogranulatus]
MCKRILGVEGYVEVEVVPRLVVRPGIRGRGTIAWHATHPATGQAVVIKDAWRNSTRPGEAEFLRAAKGISGVVQLVGYEDRCAETISYRHTDFKASHFHNRIKLRVVLKRYGPCVSQFPSRLALFIALRDAFIGHRNLLARGILHCDISLQNIIFGHPNASEGDYGILIDLDMATWANKFKSPIPPDARGTRMYQSIAVCRSLSIELVPPQSYLDDLESFFYVVTHLMFIFDRPAGVLREQPYVLKHWNSDDQELAAEAKNGFVLSPLPLKRIPPFWGVTCKVFFKEFHTVIHEILLKKVEIREDEEINEEDRLEAYEELIQQSDGYFERVKAAFDKVIATLRKEGLNAQEINAAAKLPALGESASSTHPLPSVSAMSNATTATVSLTRSVYPADTTASSAPSGSHTPVTLAASLVPITPAAPAPQENGVVSPSGSLGGSKKRPSDEDVVPDATPRKRHRKQGGAPARPKARSSKPSPKEPSVCSNPSPSASLSLKEGKHSRPPAA